MLAVVVNVPAVITTPAVDVKALPKDQAPPSPLSVTSSAPNVMALVVIVLPVVVARKMICAPEVVLNATPLPAFVQLP